MACNMSYTRLKIHACGTYNMSYMSCIGHVSCMISMDYKDGMFNMHHVCCMRQQTQMHYGR